jgi:cyanophycinase-like exopeptidase
MTDNQKTFAPGVVALIGSGETSSQGRSFFDHVMGKFAGAPAVAILETPAGFELNSHQVAGRIADFLRQHLQNYQPRVSVVPARKRGTTFSPDNPEIVAPVLEADLIFMGPGSPSYAVRQLRGSLAWQVLVARQRLGAALVLASAAAIAFSAYALPVYEIYKVGQEPHWKPGLDFFGFYGLNLVLIPHWDNRDGGEGLDTSRCYIGKSRFAQLMEMLPPDVTVVGVDERTALMLDLATGDAQVQGLGGVTIWRNQRARRFIAGDRLPLDVLGNVHFPKPDSDLPAGVWDQALEILQRSAEVPAVPGQVEELVAAREEARRLQEWSRADCLRARILEMGWEIRDTPDGPQVLPQESSE